MIGNALVFDGVCHAFNFDPSNAYGKSGEAFINHLYAFHQVLTPDGERVLGPEEFLRTWDIDEI
ncbi:MAG TPA: amidohydrolase, partial [Bacillota bacterium]